MADRELLRDRVLSEAEAVFREQGFFGVSLRQVAQNVGVHPGVLTNLFGSKRNLLRTVEERLRSQRAGVSGGDAGAADPG